MPRTLGPAPAQARDGTPHALFECAALPGGDEPAGSGVAAPSGRVGVDAAVATLVRGFVTALNTADRSAVRDFLAEHFAPAADGSTLDQRADRFLQVAANQGAITILGMERTATRRVLVPARSARQGALVLTFELDDSTPPRIRGIGLRVGS